MKDTKGMTLIEIVIVLIVIAILAGLVVPLGFRQAEVAREDATIEEMEELHRAIVGDDIYTFGYVGDMGTLPSSLEDLVTNPGSSIYSARTNDVMMGWNGPYINTGEDSDDFKTDEWGAAYDYGVVGAGQIRSYGPDKTANTADDIIFPLRSITDSSDNFKGNFTVTAFASRIDRVPNRPPKGLLIKATIYYSNNGVEASTTFENDENSLNSFLFQNVHPGIHAVKLVLTQQSDQVIFETVFYNATTSLIGERNYHVFMR